MGTMIFQLPPDLAGPAREELDRACILGGQDNMPYQTQVFVEDDQIILHRSIQESGAVLAPWNVAGAGKVMVGSGSLMERLTPYHLVMELARGKVNQVRNQMSDWVMGGLLASDPLKQGVSQAARTFTHAISAFPDESWLQLAQTAVEQSFEAGDTLVHAYIDQVLHIRHQRQAKLETAFGCRVYPGPWVSAQEKALTASFNTIAIPLSWAMIEPRENDVDWQPFDDLINWATTSNMNIVGGPLIDFSGRGLPDWLWEKDTDLLSLCGYLTDFVGMVIQRYHGIIRTWQITAGSNWAGVLALADEELLWLTVRLVEAARKADPDLELTIGLAQPMGDYLARQDHNQSPFAFADSLLRSGLRLAGLELEFVMGIHPRGSYCRDLLDVSRVLDLYALLGLPLHLTLGYPANNSIDPHGDPDLRVGSGHWRDGFQPHTQADWAREFGRLALCKPYVRGVNWVNWNDNASHQFPHCGLLDDTGNPRPALAELRKLREEHLK